MTWHEIRSTRAARPGYAKTGGRANVYGASLEQAEQLMSAAAGVGAATRPILLFYGLSQLTRAIAAASPRVPNSEYGIQGHGAKVSQMPTLLSEFPLTKVHGESGRRTSLASLGLALGCCTFERERTLEDLTKRLPIGDAIMSFGDVEPPPLSLRIERGNGVVLPFGGPGPGSARVEVGPFPRGWCPNSGATPLDVPLSDEVCVAAGLAPASTPREIFSERIGHYPGLSGWAFQESATGTVPVVRHDHAAGRIAVALMLPIVEGEHSLVIPQRVAPDLHGLRIAYPAMDDCGKPDHPLALWWAVLFSLSLLARYYPEQWTRLLNVDASEHATMIESVLEAAFQEVPRLAIDVLRGPDMTPDG